jgi:hypothetical protein
MGSLRRSLRSGGKSPTRNLDDRELVQEVMKIQRQLDEPALIRPDGISADLHLIESDFTRFPPGEHVEEAAELSAVPLSYRIPLLRGIYDHAAPCVGRADRRRVGARLSSRPPSLAAQS